MDLKQSLGRGAERFHGFAEEMEKNWEPEGLINVDEDEWDKRK